MKNNIRHDCYFYKESQEMGATIPNCSYDYTYPYGHCPCTPNCPNYISTSDARDIMIAWIKLRKLEADND